MIKDGKGYILSDELIEALRKATGLTIYEIYSEIQKEELKISFCTLSIPIVAGGMKTIHIPKELVSVTIEYKDKQSIVEIQDLNVSYYDNLFTYYKKLHKQFNNFTNKRIITLEQINTYASKGIDVYYDTNASKRNKIKSTTSFTIGELSNYTFYIFA